MLLVQLEDFSDFITKELDELNRLEEKYPGLDITVIMDQGAYIEMILSVVVKNMLIGAGLAILILALFA